jgi:hypothetical protein
MTEAFPKPSPHKSMEDGRWRSKEGELERGSKSQELLKQGGPTTTTQRFIGLTSATLKLGLERSYHPEGTLPTPWFADALDKQ